MKSIKLLVIVGPTSSGKSELAVKFAKRFNGEIISCDSRQIYKGMDLGTGKIPGRWHKFYGRKIYVYKNIPHHLIDSISPKKQCSVALFQEAAKKTIDDILARGKLPILCGGTMHWIDAIVYDQLLPDVKPNAKLRKRLKKKNADDLYQLLKKLDHARAKTVDKHNKRRLIRALEIVITTGKPIPSSKIKDKKLRMYDALWLGIKVPQKILDQKIKKRLLQRIKNGMIDEVKNLHTPPKIGGVAEGRGGIFWRRLESFGLEYRHVSLYLQGKMGYEEMIAKLSLAIRQYSKRQMTWWKRNKEIKWIKPDFAKATKLTKSFLSR